MSYEDIALEIEGWSEIMLTLSDHGGVAEQGARVIGLALIELSDRVKEAEERVQARRQHPQVRTQD